MMVCLQQIRAFAKEGQAVEPATVFLEADHTFAVTVQPENNSLDHSSTGFPAGLRCVRLRPEYCNHQGTGRLRSHKATLLWRALVVEDRATFKVSAGKDPNNTVEGIDESKNTITASVAVGLEPHYPIDGPIKKLLYEGVPVSKRCT
jgi:hypothetical protein